MSTLIAKYTYKTPDNIKPGLEDYHFNNQMGKLVNGLEGYSKPINASDTFLSVKHVSREVKTNGAVISIIEVFYKAQRVDHKYEGQNLLLSEEKPGKVDTGKSGGKVVAKGSTGHQEVATF